jgi:hypothetical protein
MRPPLLPAAGCPTQASGRVSAEEHVVFVGLWRVFLVEVEAAAEKAVRCQWSVVSGCRFRELVTGNRRRRSAYVSLPPAPSPEPRFFCAHRKSTIPSP